MKPSSRTPEGERNRCPVCGNVVRTEPSRPPGDAPCPHCGHLLWFGPKKRTRRRPKQEKPAAELADVQEPVESACQELRKKESAKQGADRGKGDFTLSDFKKLIGQIRKIGPFQKIISMIIPGMGGITQNLAEADSDKELRRLAGIIDAMTPDERQAPGDLLDKSRQSRIAEGAGVGLGDVRSLIRQFKPMADLMKRMSAMSVRDRMRQIRSFSQRGHMDTGKRLTSEERARLKRLREDEGDV
jgi:signal recognition particle subunit SRP54